MRLLRSRLLLRLVSTLCVAGLAATLAPAADARPDALAGLLDDVAAFEAALDAAHAVPVEDAREAFVDAYVAASDGAVAPEAVRQLLDGDAMGLVAPPVAPKASVPSPGTAGTPMGVAGLPPTAPGRLAASASAHLQAAETALVAGAGPWASSPRGP